jgi:hypothetical protein
MNQKLEPMYVNFVRRIAENGIPEPKAEGDDSPESYLRSLVAYAQALHRDLLAGGYGK